MKKLISMGLMLYILKFVVAMVTGMYVPDMIIWCILGYNFINDSGLIKEAKEAGDKFKAGFDSAS